MKNQVSSFYKDAVNSVNIGLRKYMLNVFSHMSIGLALTGLIALGASLSQAVMSVLFSTGMYLILAFAQVGIVFYLSSRINKMSASSAQFWFYSYAILLGLSLAPIFLIYTGESITTAFFGTSATFLSMVLYGYSTDRDLTGFGAFLTMGLFGLIIASVINFFVGSSSIVFMTSILGILIFVGLTAWDTQAIKSIYYEEDSQENSEKKAILGALRLYLDFINIFIYLLRLFGSRRN